MIMQSPDSKSEMDYSQQQDIQPSQPKDWFQQITDRVEEYQKMDKSVKQIQIIKNQYKVNTYELQNLDNSNAFWSLFFNVS